MNILFKAAKLGFFRNTDDADVVIGVDRPLTPLVPAGNPAADDCVESIRERETTLGIDVMDRLLALGNRPSLSSGFLLLRPFVVVVDEDGIFADALADAFALGPEPAPAVVPGQ